MKKGGQDVKAIYFNVYKQDNVTGNGPTHTWKNFNLREDIIIPAGTYDIKFFPSSIKNPNQGNLKIEPAGSRPQNKPNQDRVYGTKDTYKSPYSNTDMLDDHLE